jgi:hypothetical protein
LSHLPTKEGPPAEGLKVLEVLEVLDTPFLRGCRQPHRLKQSIYRFILNNRLKQDEYFKKQIEKFIFLFFLFKEPEGEKNGVVWNFWNLVLLKETDH